MTCAGKLVSFIKGMYIKSWADWPSPCCSIWTNCVSDFTIYPLCDAAVLGFPLAVVRMWVGKELPDTRQNVKKIEFIRGKGRCQNSGLTS